MELAKFLEKPREWPLRSHNSVSNGALGINQNPKMPLRPR